jgi:cytidine deaminase
MNHEIHQTLCEAAISVRQRAYARYSQFAVGAALYSASGQTFLGCNVENASYGLTICAERAAVFAAVAAGQREFTLLAIASKGGVTPCGACRQVLAEFAPNLPILLINSDDPGKVTITNLHDLLPHAFQLTSGK